MNTLAASGREPEGFRGPWAFKDCLEVRWLMFFFGPGGGAGVVDILSV